MVSREEREALHSEAVLSFGDMAAAIESDEYERAQALRPAVEAVCRLLDDIGWGAGDEGEKFAVTMPGQVLAVALYHLGHRALARLLSRPAESWEADETSRAEARQCELVVGVGDRRTDDLRRLVQDQRAGRRPVAASRLEPVPLRPLRVSRERRDELRLHTFLNQATLTETLPTALRTGDYQLAREVRVALEADWYLLDEIGWQPEDPRASFEVWLPDRTFDRAKAQLEWIEEQRPVAQSVQRIGALVIDAKRHVVTLRDEPVALTPVEFSLLRTLAIDPERVFDRRELLRLMWGHRAAQSRTLDSHAIRLRRKLARDGDRFVINVRGIGYSLLPAEGT